MIVLVHDGSKLLLGQRPRAPWRSLIAGFVEAGESLEEAARREVLEETGVLVGPLEYAGSQTWPFPNQLMVGFFAAYASGEVRHDPAELEDAGWFEATDLPPIPPPISIASKMIVTYRDRVLGRSAQAVGSESSGSE